MPFDVARALAGAPRRELRAPRGAPEPPARAGAQDPRLRPLLRARRGLLPLRRPGREVPRFPGRIRGLRARTQPSGGQGGARTRRSISTCPTWCRWTARCCPGLLAEQLLAARHGGIDRVFFCNSGAEAVESAIKFARQATKRSRHRLRRARLPRSEHRRALAQRRRGVPRGFRAAAPRLRRRCRSATSTRLKRAARAREPSPRSSSSRSRARASTRRHPTTGTRRRSCAASTRRCS